mmetsp:Transcript_1105/g.3560  ORF Transcript_1105/g.3560 Transcript_1105/m.3560 type:complete len:178 (-) Transcript_1105:12-545(-)
MTRCQCCAAPTSLSAISRRGHWVLSGKRKLGTNGSRAPGVLAATCCAGEAHLGEELGLECVRTLPKLACRGRLELRGVLKLLAAACGPVHSDSGGWGLERCGRARCSLSSTGVRAPALQSLDTSSSPWRCVSGRSVAGAATFGRRRGSRGTHPGLHAGPVPRSREAALPSLVGNHIA